MIRTKRGGWPYASPPNTQFTINRQSPQAQGLVALWSCFAQRGQTSLRDLVGVADMTPGDAPTITANEWGPVPLFNDEDTEMLYSTSSPVSGPPFSVAAWVWPDEDGSNLIAASFGDTDAIQPYIALEVEGGVAGDPASFRLYNAGSDYLRATTGVTFNAWNHLCGVAAADDDRRVYCNGGGKSTSAVNKSLAGADRWAIGVSADSTPIYYFSGAIAEVRVYNRALSSAEVRALYNPATRWELYAPAVRTVIANISILAGEVVWGHSTAVLESNVRAFDANWTGTGLIENAGAGDTERIELNAGEYMISEVVETGAATVQLLQNEYDGTGDDVDLDYRHGATSVACQAAGWNNYTVPFMSAGYVQIRVTSTL